MRLWDERADRTFRRTPDPIGATRPLRSSLRAGTLSRVSIDPAIIAVLDELARTPFSVRAWREVWRAHGWTWTRGKGDELGFQVDLPQLTDPLSVDPLGDAIVGARLAFYWWEDFEPQGGYDSEDEYARDGRAYHEAFDRAREIAIGVLGQAAAERRDHEARRAIVWERSHGLLLLQEALYDAQRGAELSFWLEPCGLGALPDPDEPLVEWIADRSEARHAEGGYPSLPE